MCKCSRGTSRNETEIWFRGDFTLRKYRPVEMKCLYLTISYFFYRFDVSMLCAWVSIQQPL